MKQSRKKYISTDALHKKWMKKPAYRKAYEALEDEFSRVRKQTKAKVPNKKTIAAIKEARRSKLKDYPNSKALLRALNEDG